MRLCVGDDGASRQIWKVLKQSFDIPTILTCNDRRETADIVWNLRSISERRIIVARRSMNRLRFEEEWDHPKWSSVA